MLESEVKSLFIRFKPIYFSLVNPIICVLETKEKARDFLLSEYYKFIKKKCFDLLKPYDDYNVLKKDDIIKIIKNKINKLKNKYKQKQIDIKISPSIVEEICEISDYEIMGARKIDKIIKDKLAKIRRIMGCLA